MRGTSCGCSIHHLERLRAYCGEVRPLGTTFSPYAMAYENGKAIAFCRNVKPGLAALWPLLKDYS
ncbi:MAG: hypothetical protein NVS3B7_19540 [Candidatus Elarobacter sp.]